YRIDDAFYGIADPGHLAQFGDVLDQITLEDVNAALKKHLQLADMTIAIVTGDAAGLQKALESEAPSTIEYPSPKAAEILEEDKVIATHPLNIASVETLPVQEIFQR
ncbi:MAG: insulinase family protein, partial [Acidobacteriota bacterium]